MKMDEKQEERIVNQDGGLEWKLGMGEPCPADVFEFAFAEFRQVQHETFGQRLVLAFDTVDEFNADGDPYRVECWTSPSFSPRGKVRPMLTALGEDVDKLDPKTFKLSRYLGKRLRIAVEHEERKGKDGGTYTNAIPGSFLPIRKSSRRDEREEREDDRQPVAAGNRDEEKETRKARLREED